MGGISIIARRLEGGNYVQYGFSGIGGNFGYLGLLLMEHYDSPERVDYLFDLGQLNHLGRPYSENGGYSFILTTDMENKPHHLDRTERSIFSKIAFIDHGYFYDLDNQWYFVMPGPFRIKIPAIYMFDHMDTFFHDEEWDERHRISENLIRYLLGEYYENDIELQELVKNTYEEDIAEIREKVFKANWPEGELFHKYKAIFEYFDDWVVAIPGRNNQYIKFYIVKRYVDDNDRIETIYWEKDSATEEDEENMNERVYVTRTEMIKEIGAIEVMLGMNISESDIISRLTKTFNVSEEEAKARYGECLDQNK